MVVVAGLTLVFGRRRNRGLGLVVLGAVLAFGLGPHLYDRWQLGRLAAMVEDAEIRSDLPDLRGARVAVVAQGCSALCAALAAHSGARSVHVLFVGSGPVDPSRILAEAHGGSAVRAPVAVGGEVIHDFDAVMPTQIDWLTLRRRTGLWTRIEGVSDLADDVSILDVWEMAAADTKGPAVRLIRALRDVATPVLPFVPVAKRARPTEDHDGFLRRLICAGGTGSEAIPCRFLF